MDHRVTIAIIKKPERTLKYVQFFLGVLTFILYVRYQCSIAITYNMSTYGELVVRSTFASTTIVAFPFIYTLLVLISLCISGDTLVQNNVLLFLFNIVGCGMYLITGSMIVHFLMGHLMGDGMKVAAGMCMVTSFTYFCDILLHVWKKWRNEFMTSLPFKINA